VQHLQVVSLNSVVEETCRMLPCVNGEDIEMRLELGRDVGRVRLTPGKSLLNLAINARDAMPKGGRSALRLVFQTDAIADLAGLARISARRLTFCSPSPIPVRGSQRGATYPGYSSRFIQRNPKAQAPVWGWRWFMRLSGRARVLSRPRASRQREHIQDLSASCSASGARGCQPFSGGKARAQRFRNPAGGRR
jgi:hypothetical protein